MLMSKSRLEKFLYALYSLDSSDLPKPLSRIEELYNCLVTGDEVPTFEPLSRVEKYLMAILGVYDVDSLPNPISRVEVLLYKLAVGDDNLDDVKSFLSEHEELLAEIIRNGGVGGSIDIEYVLHVLSTEYSTLYNTAEKPVKSAVLKGQTLVNLVGEKRLYGNGVSHLYGWEFMLPCNLTKGKTYLAVFNATGTLSSTNSKVYLMDNGFDSESGNSEYPVDFKVGYNMVKCVASGDNHRVLRIRTGAVTLNDLEVSDVMLIEYQEGMENWDIPYFEGIQSVKMPVLTTTGKNLFNISLLPQTVNIIPTSKGYTLKGYSCGTGMLMSKMFQNLIVGKRYVLSFKSSSSGTINAQNSIGFYNENTEDLLYYRNNESFILTNEMYYERRVVLYGVNNETVEFSNVQLEEGSVATEYEPYKSTTVTCNEDVELRGVGGVKDELDLMTGEVTQRIGEYQITGEENWVFISNFRRLQLSKSEFTTNIKCGVFACDILQAKQGNDASLHDVVGTYYTGYTKDNWLRIILGEDLTSLEQGKEWLKANKPTIQYQLATESVKTVDISTVDQDGNNTKLKSFDDITYVTLSSEGLIPEAEMEVATKNEEVLDTMSLGMDGIYSTQTTLEETSNTQSENVDATMFATTEIYEGLL